MKILFIRPQIPNETIGLQHVMIVEPLELENLATLVETEHDVKIIDMILENKPVEHFIREYNPDMVCLTGYITHIYEMIHVCSVAKKINPEIITVVGGVYIEKVPESIDHPDVDYRVVRNGLQSFKGLVEFIAQKEDFPNGILKKGEQMDESVLPPYDFTTCIPNRKLTQSYRKHYFYVFHNKVALIKTSFGCPFPCNFCFCRKITGDQYFERELDIVIEELLTIEEKEVYIIDDNFLVSEKRVQKFLELLKMHNIYKKYLIYGRADFIASHPDLMKQFKALGLRTVIVGFESFNDQELQTLDKRSMASINEQAMKVLNSYGIDCYASIIAMPGWSKEDFAHATKKMVDLKIRFLNIQPLTPLEKTDIQFDDSQLIISRKEYPKWDLAHVMIQPEKMSVKEFYEEIIKMYIKVLFRPSNLIHHLKFSLPMQLKLLYGAYKVKVQYKKKVSEIQ